MIDHQNRFYGVFFLKRRVRSTTFDGRVYANYRTIVLVMFLVRANLEKLDFFQVGFDITGHFPGH